MTYLGNLTCSDCGLTFTSRWGSVPGADEYRCEHDHSVQASSTSGVIVLVEDTPVEGPSLADLRGLCPLCRTELASGLLPQCPVCGGRDHDVRLDGTLG